MSIVTTKINKCSGLYHTRFRMLQWLKTERERCVKLSVLVLDGSVTTGFSTTSETPLESERAFHSNLIQRTALFKSHSCVKLKGHKCVYCPAGTVNPHPSAGLVLRSVIRRLQRLIVHKGGDDQKKV